jgi:excisionase family DNA binding protein
VPFVGSRSFFCPNAMRPNVQTDWMPEPALLSLKQSAAYLNVSERTIRNLLNRGELVRRRIGGRTLVPLTSLQSFLKRDHPTK